jgi:LysR substrate binding domain
VRLVDRSARGVEPTAYGAALLKRSVAAFDELKQGIRDFEFLLDQAAGEVRIAAPAVLAAGFVAAAIDRLNRRYPRVVCHLAVEVEPNRPLEARDVDLAIGDWNAFSKKDIRSQMPSVNINGRFVSDLSQMGVEPAFGAVLANVVEMHEKVPVHIQLAYRAEALHHIVGLNRV